MLLATFGIHDDNLFVFLGGEIDIDLRKIIALTGVSLYLQTIQGGEQTGQALLAIKNERNGFPVLRRRQGFVAEIAYTSQAVLRRPKDECADRIPFDHTVQQCRGLLDIPHEIALKLRYLDPSAAYVVDEIAVVGMCRLR
ncbi:MAG: hypothetical protein OXL95_05500 [Nitrospira sp.]|nr:hypothetical protein [Nitrospira sp.]